MFFENSMHNRWGGGGGGIFFFFFQYLPKIQSHRVTASLKAGGFKVFDARGREIFLRKNLTKLFRNDVRYVGLATETFCNDVRYVGSA